MKFLNTLIVLLILSQNVFAHTLNGKVMDEKSFPVFGAEITNTENEAHTHSNLEGVFSLEHVALGDTIIVSMFGFETQTLLVESLEDTLVVVLKPKNFSLQEVTIKADVNALSIISDVDLSVNPVNSSQEILRQVPGLVIGQHAGGGKAEQIFLRGFDIDHGTDIAISTDGIPTNMVSHAHGQGYADLHYVIPETIEKIDFGKGAYYADKGDFNTAGYVDFISKNSLDKSLLSVEAGRFNTYRLLGMFNLVNAIRNKSYIATEYIYSDGPFESSQAFNRFNVFGKYTGYLKNSDKIAVSFSHFNSKWDASGQIPQRAVDAGLITRFGAIDDTEGGKTSRTNVSVDYTKALSESATISNKLYYSNYNFELFSNFTFFLEDSINGDQIKQHESRHLMGLQSDYKKLYQLEKLDIDLNVGASFRNDRSLDNELSRTKNRTETLEQIQFGNINQTNAAGYVSVDFSLKKWLFNAAVRLDYFNFQYNDHLQTAYETKKKSAAIVNPKLNIIYNHSQKLQLYAKFGRGFHSNDTRVAIPQNGREILPASYGTDVGVIWKPIDKLFFNLGYWFLYLEQEFVYVGDAGIVEPSGKTRRMGVDFSMRYQPVDWFYATLDANYTHARAIDEADGEDNIPLAPDLTLTSSANFQLDNGFFASLRLRYLKDRPANEDNSLVAKGYAIVDMNAGYQWKRLSFGVQIQNLFNSDWNETQFATESRLQNEAEPVEEIHFTPGTPFMISGKIGFEF